jgi:glycosyltransferase involved in cell wall biosynthesis
MISVSVAMATCNGQKYIRRQLDSLAAQRQIPAELVITDDKSEDNTISIVDAFARTAPFPVRIYQNEARLGYRANFMRAAGLCQSELIGFCDQDDYWYPQKIEMSVKPFSDPEVLLVYHNADIVTDEGRLIGSLAKRAPKESILLPMSSGPWLHALGFTQIFRRSLLRLSDLWPDSIDQTLFDQPLAHDQWFFFLATVFGKIAYLDERLVAYVRHESNTAFGAQKTSFRDSVRLKFRRRAVEYPHFSRAAKSRAAILEIAKDSLEGVWAERAAAAIERYKKLSWLYATRSTLYTSPNFSGRLKAFGTVLVNGGYTGAWGFGGLKSIVPDMCLGLAGPLLPKTISQA